MAHTLLFAGAILVAAIFAGGSSRASGMPNQVAADSRTCWLLALSRQEWPTMLDWYLAGDIKKLPSRETARDPCRPAEPKTRARKPNRD